MATVERDLPREKYTIVSNEVVRDEQINANAFRVYAYLASLSPETSTNRFRVAGALGMSSGTVQKALASLERAGYLQRNECRNRDGTHAEGTWILSNTKPEPEPVYKKPYPDNPPVPETPLPTSPLSILPVSVKHTPAPYIKTLPIKTCSSEKDFSEGKDGASALGDDSKSVEEIIREMAANLSNRR